MVVGFSFGGPIRRFVPLLLSAIAALCRAQAACAQQTPLGSHPAALPPVVTEQVNVTATRSPVPIGETAKTVDTLDSEQLHDYPSPVLDDTLRQHAGFELFRRSSSRVTNPTSQGISLRGLGSTAVSRTLVLEEGAPLNDPFGGWIHWNESPASTLDSVTIVTGGGSDLYGSSALGGVIDVLPAALEKTLFDATAYEGSQDSSTVDLRGDRRLHALDTMLAGEQLRTAGYVIVAPQVAGTVDVPANVHSESLRTELGRRSFAMDRFFLVGNFLNEARGNGTPDTTNATRLWRYIGGYDSPESSAVPVRARLFGSDEGYRQSFSSVLTGRVGENLTRNQRVRTQELGATADASYHLKHVAFVIGADVRDIRGEDHETPIAQGVVTGLQAVTARQRYTGGFGEVLGEFGGWSGAVSVRLDAAQNLDTHQINRTATVNTLTNPPNRTEYVPSPRAGLVRQLGSHANVHASGFRAFRSPTLNELYRTGQVGSETTLANASLESERATGWEVGTQLLAAAHGTSLQATYFWTEINRPVSTVVLTQTATAITDMRENLGQIRSRGVELSADMFRGRAIWASAGYQFANATVTAFSAQSALVGNRIPQVPRHTATAQLHARSARLGEATLALRTSSSAFDDSANTFLLRRFFTLDLSAKRSLTHNVDAFVLVQNLFNQRPDVSRTPILTLGSPIFAEAGLHLRFGSAK